MKYSVTFILFLLCSCLLAQSTQEILSQLYTVKKGDTAYSIARQHGITVERLYEANPSLRTEKLKKGSFIIIPSKPSPVIETPVVVSEPAPVPTVASKRFDVLRVAVLLPFEEKSNRAPKFLEFYQGFLLAADSLRSRGKDLTIYALNTGKTKEQIKQLLEEPELQSMHLIIGPADQAQVPLLSDFCEKHRIKLVLPFSHLKAASGEHSTVYHVTPANHVLQEQAVNQLLRKLGKKNYVTVRTEKADEKGSGFVQAFAQQLTMQKQTMQVLPLLADHEAYAKAMSMYTENYLIPDNTSIKTLNILFSQLSAFREAYPEYRISVIGYPEWQTYTSNLLQEFYQFDTYFYSAYFYNPLWTQTADFERKFVNHFSRQLAFTFPRYGALGFDLGYYFMAGLLSLGTEFDAAQQTLEYNPIQHPFRFTRDPQTRGFVNEASLIIHYTPQHLIEVIP